MLQSKLIILVSVLPNKAEANILLTYRPRNWESFDRIEKADGISDFICRNRGTKRERAKLYRFWFDQSEKSLHKSRSNACFLTAESLFTLLGCEREERQGCWCKMQRLDEFCCLWKGQSKSWFCRALRLARGKLFSLWFQRHISEWLSRIWGNWNQAIWYLLGFGHWRTSCNTVETKEFVLTLSCVEW